MAGYIGNKSSVVSSGAERKFKFTITETTTTLSNIVYTPTLVHVFHNGVRLVDGTDYTATNGTSITLNNAAENGDEVVVISYASFQTSDTVSASAGGTFGGNITINADLTVSGNTDINGGTIDGTVIGGSTPAAISGTTGTFSSDMTGTDLYLSGGVYLGGTGAANYLDDYEEGTWTASLVGANSATISTQQYNKYVKIGDWVYVSGYLDFSGSDTSTNSIQISGLPFTSGVNCNSTGSCIDKYGAGFTIVPYMPNEQSYFQFYQSGTSSGQIFNLIAYNEVGAYAAHFHIAYRTA